MTRKSRHVAILGAGITGLSAAHALARHGHQVSVIEKQPFIGGHAAQFACKAVENCVKCGACLVEEKLRQTADETNITFFTGTTIQKISRKNGLHIAYQRRKTVVDPEKCDGCGRCIQKCPRPGALAATRTVRPGPPVTVRRELCLYFKDQSCSRCREVCPHDAIDLTADGMDQGALKADALLVAVGFQPFDPSAKPYGHGRLENVRTNLDIERELRLTGEIRRPSDKRRPQSVAFIQCVGSRDARLGHLWCSKICCGSALRLAHRVRVAQPDLSIAFFYIDVQTFGKDFDTFFRRVGREVEMFRAIPSDVFAAEDDRLKLIYFDPGRHQSHEKVFDMLVLSVGLVPPSDTQALSQMLGWPLADSGFFQGNQGGTDLRPQDIFSAGAVQGPMSIAESIASGGKAALDIMLYFDTADA